MWLALRLQGFMDPGSPGRWREGFALFSSLLWGLVFLAFDAFLVVALDNPTQNIPAKYFLSVFLAP
jgi:hypothetical protein